MDGLTLSTVWVVVRVDILCISLEEKRKPYGKSGVKVKHGVGDYVILLQMWKAKDSCEARACSNDNLRTSELPFSHFGWHTIQPLGRHGLLSLLGTFRCCSCVGMGCQAEFRKTARRVQLAAFTLAGHRLKA